jgi:hypothetical protein
MVHHPEIIPTVSKEGILREFENPILQKIGQELESLYLKRGKFDVAETLGFLEGDLQRKLCEFVFQGSGLEGGLQEKMLKDCIEKIRKKRLKKDESELLKKIKEAENQQEDKRLFPLLKERQELVKRERGLQKDSIRKV